MSDVYKLAVSVKDGDFTAWVIHDDHAYPFADATDAAAAVYIDGIENFEVGDEDFVVGAYDPEVWWDQDPDTLAELAQQVRGGGDDD